MTFDTNTGLVLEGGGMRGVFTDGVLDYFLDNNITFNYGVGVSAGACNGLSYLSRQRGRAKVTNIDMLEKHRYIGMKYCGHSTAFSTASFCTTPCPTRYCLSTTMPVLPIP